MIWRRSAVDTIQKRMKPEEDPNGYPTKFLPCVLYKILERFIYTRVETIINPCLLGSKLGFDGKVNSSSSSVYTEY